MRIATIASLALVWACGGKDAGTGGPSTGAATGPTTGSTTGTATGTTAGSPGGTPTGTATGGPSTSVEVGNGEQSHVPVSPGQAVTMVHGPQNGWHIEVSGLVQGLGDVISVEVSATRVGTGELIADNGAATFLQLAGYDDTTQTGWFAGERATIDRNQAGICALEGAELDLCVLAEDLAAPGVIAQGCAQVVAALDSADVAVCAGGTGTGTGTTTGTPTGAATGTGTP